MTTSVSEQVWHVQCNDGCGRTLRVTPAMVYRVERSAEVYARCPCGNVHWIDLVDIVPKAGRRFYSTVFYGVIIPVGYKFAPAVEVTSPPYTDASWNREVACRRCSHGWTLQISDLWTAEIKGSDWGWRVDYNYDCPHCKQEGTFHTYMTQTGSTRVPTGLEDVPRRKFC